MLTIRSSQLSLLGTSRREAFEAWLAPQLEARFPQHTSALGPDGLVSFVTRAVDRAGRYRITSASAVAAFAGYLIEFGENFEFLPDNSDAVAILEDNEFPGQVKIQLLDECLARATGGRRLAPPD